MPLHRWSNWNGEPKTIIYRDPYSLNEHKAIENGFATTMLRGIFAGWLIALMVWLLPFAATARV